MSNWPLAKLYIRRLERWTVQGKRMAAVRRKAVEAINADRDGGK